ncbi:FXYD domain-containing ion transport regulator [Balamuthia mandrillaris]
MEGNQGQQLVPTYKSLSDAIAERLARGGSEIRDKVFAGRTFGAPAVCVGLGIGLLGLGAFLAGLALTLREVRKWQKDRSRFSAQGTTHSTRRKDKDKERTDPTL